ncbi:hypothetical protein [uncultured Fusobacterium sp.]|uniref:hypothetical protein n=1 Tax=uncultured Fusobacterium sp. TaxID=159267 RepID=UPI002588C089|nr:hypothetical protein [uncultured Fusobacterium sp.]
MNRKYTGIIGSLMVIIGLFLPVLKINDMNIALLTNENTTILAIIIVLLGVLSVINIYKGKYSVARCMSFGIIVGLMVTFIENYIDFKKLEGFSYESIVELFKEYGISWGWIILFLGAIISVYSTTWLKEEYEKDEIEILNL